MNRRYLDVSTDIHYTNQFGTDCIIRPIRAFLHEAHLVMPPEPKQYAIIIGGMPQPGRVGGASAAHAESLCNLAELIRPAKVAEKGASLRCGVKTSLSHLVFDDQYPYPYYDISWKNVMYDLSGGCIEAFEFMLGRPCLWVRDDTLRVWLAPASVDGRVVEEKSLFMADYAFAKTRCRDCQS